MSTFDALDPLVQHHIVNTLGWRELRPLQEQSIGPVLNGDHCLLLAPTAGGKTEAASFPILSKICSENWSGLSVVYVCPLKALLNNLHERLDGYCRMVGRRCELWHGDVSASRRNRIKSDPPAVLLTTPESLEVMLISTKQDGREMLKDLKIVVIDEIHAFAGDDRGWHLLAVLERIGRLAGRELQRIGLSATVGNPDDLLNWLAGHCEGRGVVVQPTAPGATSSTEVQLDYVGSLRNAAIVISRLYRGEKRLVFCDSRSRVEELGTSLRQMGITVFLSHSSLSADERKCSEEAFSQAQDCVIVATSTLELGIDVGNLDRVIQIDAPWTVASFLQRLGRTGRREGTTRNCLFLATSEEALMRAAALLKLWEVGFVEPISPPAKPLHLFAQQLMALALQEGGIGGKDWFEWLGRLPCFAEVGQDQLEKIVSHLQEKRIMYSDGVRLGFAEQGERLYGRRHFMDLVSVFTSEPVFKVLHGKKELGSVDQITFARKKEDEGMTVLTMGGRNWQVTSLDWKRREAYVTPTELKGKSQWQGKGQSMSSKLARQVREILVNEDEPKRWSTRSKEAIAKLRDEFAFLDPDEDIILVESESNKTSWYTFAGAAANLFIGQILEGFIDSEYRVNEYCIQFVEKVDPAKITKVKSLLMNEEQLECFDLDPDFLQQLKFSDCLPLPVVNSMMNTRLVDQVAIQEAMARDIKPCYVG